MPRAPETALLASTNSCGFELVLDLAVTPSNSRWLWNPLALRGSIQTAPGAGRRPRGEAGGQGGATSQLGRVLSAGSWLRPRSCGETAAERRLRSPGEEDGEGARPLGGCQPSKPQAPSHGESPPPFARGHRSLGCSFLEFYPEGAAQSCCRRFHLPQHQCRGDPQGMSQPFGQLGPHP